MKNVIADLKGKVVIVSGGTRGIGFATVAAFLEQGAKVAVLGSRKETVDKALAALANYNEDVLIGRYPDITCMDDCEKLVNEVKNLWGSIDVLINNAGVSDAQSFHEYTADTFKNVMDINVNALFNLTKAVTPVMKAQGKGNIINTSSIVSLYGQQAGVSYPTSKFAVNGMTKSLARELGRDGIRVNAIAPGIIKTDMVSALDPAMIAAMGQQVPMQRLGESEDIANAFLYLASDMSSYVSGAILSVDGAYVLG